MSDISLTPSPQKLTALALDGTGAGAIVMHWFGMMPTIAGTLATLAAFVWYGCQIADWVMARRQRRQRAEKTDGPPDQSEH